MRAFREAGDGLKAERREFSALELRVRPRGVLRLPELLVSVSARREERLADDPARVLRRWPVPLLALISATTLSAPSLLEA